LIRKFWSNHRCKPSILQTNHAAWEKIKGMIKLTSLLICRKYTPTLRFIVASSARVNVMNDFKVQMRCHAPNSTHRHITQRLLLELEISIYLNRPSKKKKKKSWLCMWQFPLWLKPTTNNASFFFLSCRDMQYHKKMRVFWFQREHDYWVELGLLKIQFSIDGSTISMGFWEHMQRIPLYGWLNFVWNSYWRIITL